MSAAWLPRLPSLMVQLAWLRFAPGAARRVQAALADQPATTPGNEDDGARLAALLARVRRAARFVPSSRCLDQALATCQRARSMGIPAQLQLGMRRDGNGFMAHAWVTLDGEAIGEDPAALARLTPFAPGRSVRFDG